MVSIRNALDADVDVIAADCREADRRELWALAYLTPAQALRLCMETSDEAWTGFADGKPVVMWGVSTGSLIGRVGMPWLVATHAMESGVAVQFLYNCRPQLLAMKRKYDMLENYVDERNVVAKRWLRWMGFKFDEPKKTGALGLPFSRFHMEGERCAHQ